MYLKSIDVQGFKSFANKINFEFHNGITGIVGPNGSGKSNVVDAVRWVFGEQSAKQLRGGNMQDIIFSGTELRKPQGYAYVAITLDNSDHMLPIDFDEVIISRRLYRSGESEYMINGSACRLKDVSEIFYDTGIGKEGYSIIGQSQVDKILSVKPDDRRELFDEAAGITKFKRRKFMSQKKLDSERTNLTRISDILSELEKQVGPLKKQADDAREYLRLRDSLKKFDINLFLIESISLQNQLTELTRKESILKDDFIEANSNYDKLKTEYEELDMFIKQLDTNLNKTRDDMSNSNIELGDLNGRINVLNEQINTEKMNAEHINSRISTIVADINLKQIAIDTYNCDKIKLAEIAAEAAKKQQQAEKVLFDEDEAIMLLDQHIEDSKSAMITAINEKAEVSAKVERYVALLEQIHVRKSELAQKLLKIKSDESTMDQQFEDEKNKLDKIEIEISTLAIKLTELQQKTGDFEIELIGLSKNLNEIQARYQNESAKLESLKNIAERYDGYGNSIKKIMETRDRVIGIHGVVADLIVVDKDYEVAIETALGGKIQNVVTDSEETAKQLIEYLKKNKFGRATFLPLTSIGNKSHWDPGMVLKEKGVLGVASSLVKSDKQYNGLINYLLGRILVVDNIEHAIAIERNHNYEYRIVTKEGELLNPGGSLSGGAFKNTSNLLGRKREIEDLESMLEKSLNQAELIQNQLDVTKNMVKTKQNELEDIKIYKQKLLIDKNTIQININKISERKLEISDSSDDLIYEHNQLKEQIADITDNKSKSLDNIKSIEINYDELEKDIKASSIQLEKSKTTRELHSKEVYNLQLDTANAKQKLSFIGENLNRIINEIAKLNEETKTLSTGDYDSKSIIDKKIDDIHNTKLRISEITEIVLDLNKNISELIQKQEEKSIKQKLCFKKREELSEKISMLDKDIFRLQSQKDKCEERLDVFVKYIWNEYELTFQTAQELRDDKLIDLSEIKKSIDELKNNIRQLGSVNVNAVENYTEVSQRYQLLKTQHDDIISAEQTLKEIILELDKGMRKQFEEQFNFINKEFDKVFKELFGGGTGKLELDVDVDILEAGIHIISQPPGKKLQNMMQLSGGEKALTAIALLFAIQNLKPSPFALLDEIEAALDDSNVDRFAKYLHKLTKNTQFIVITHRRGTMVAADRLYGITMQEKGVSTLVSVNLIEDKLDN